MRKTRSNSSLIQEKNAVGLTYSTSSKRQRRELVAVPNPDVITSSLQPLRIDTSVPRASSADANDDRYQTPSPYRSNDMASPFVTPRGHAAPPLIDIDAVAAAKGNYDPTYAKTIAKTKFSQEILLRYSSFESYQNLITVTMHAILVDWLCDVAEEHNIPLDTYCLSIHLLDRFMTKRIDFPRDLFQLVGCAALLLASKLEMTEPILAASILGAADNHFSAEQLVAMEADLLLTLGAKISLPTRYYFFQRFVLASGLRHMREQHFAEYLTLATLLDFSFNSLPMSLTCAAVIHYCREMFRPPSEEVWTPLLQVTTGYSESAIAHAVYLVQKLHYRLPTVNLQHLNRRFNRDVYSFCSKFIPLRLEDLRFDCASLAVRNSEPERSNYNTSPCPDDTSNCEEDAPRSV